MKYVVAMSRKEIYDGWYKLDDEVVYVWSADSDESAERDAPKVTRLPEVGPMGMMRGVYAPRDHRKFLADRDLECSGGCERDIPAGEPFRFVGKKHKFRRPICSTCFDEGRYPDVQKAWGYTSEPDYSGNDMPDHSYIYGRRRSVQKSDDTISPD